MASLIDATKPVYGNPTTQSVRDNFSYAHDEITDLQGRTALAPFLPILGGIMNGPITMQVDPANPLEVATKRYVDNLAFGATGGVPEAPTDGFAYARENIVGGMTWSKIPQFQTVNLTRDGTTVDFHLGSDATYNFVKFAEATNDYLRFNRSTSLFELVANNVVVQSWNSTATAIANLTASNVATISGSAPTLNLVSPTVADEYIYFKTAANKRWAIGADAGATGLGIYRYDASGVIIDKPFSIGRTDGTITLTHTLSINPTDPSVNWPNIYLNGPNTTEKSIYGTVGGLNRWQITFGDRAAESTGNQGSNFYITRFSDAGAYIDSPIAINRTTGGVDIGNPKNTFIRGSLGLGGYLVPNNTYACWSFQNGMLANNWTANIYHDGTNWRYFANGQGWIASMDDTAGFNIYHSASGTAGNISATMIRLLNLDAAGSLNVTANLNCVDIHNTGGTYTTNEVWGSNIRATNGMFYIAPGGYYMQRDSNGYWNWVEGNQLNFRIQNDGVAMARAAFYVSNSMSTYDFGIVKEPDGTKSLYQSGQPYRLYWQVSTGTTILILNSQWLWSMRNDYLCGNNVTQVFGKGPYADYSDDRAKHNVVNSEIGLEEILKINPISFMRIHNLKQPDPNDENARPLYIPPDRLEIGFSAQQLRPIIPEAVVELGLELPDGSGGMDSDDPTLAIVTTPIVAGLVNSMKTLNARLAILENRS